MGFKDFVKKWVKKIFKPKPKPKPKPAPKPKPKPKPKQKLPDPFNPDKPFGKQLPGHVQKAPSTPKKTGGIPNFTPAKKKSGGGGGGGGGGSSPNFTDTAGNKIFVPPGETTVTQGPLSGSSSGGTFDQIQSSLPAGLQPGATAGEKAAFGLSVVPGGGFASKLTNKIAQEALKTGAIKKGSFKLITYTDKLGKLLATETVEKTSPELAKVASGVLTEAAKKKTSGNLGKVVWNTKNAQKGMNVIKKIVKNKKWPFFALTTATAVFGGGLYLAQQTSDDYTDGISDINFKISEAARMGDDEEVEHLYEIYQEAIQTVNEVDGLGIFNAFAAAKFKIKIDSKLIESNYKIFNNAKQSKIDLDTGKLTYENLQQKNDLELQELKQQNALQQQQANIELQELKDANNEKEYLRQLKLSKKKAKLWNESQALMAKQHAAELEAELAAYIKKQKIYQEAWEKKQKYFADNEKSQLKFGLLG